MVPLTGQTKSYFTKEVGKNLSCHCGFEFELLGDWRLMSYCLFMSFIFLNLPKQLENCLPFIPIIVWQIFISPLLYFFIFRYLQLRNCSVTYQLVELALWLRIIVHFLILFNLIECLYIKINKNLVYHCSATSLMVQIQESTNSLRTTEIVSHCYSCIMNITSLWYHWQLCRPFLSQPTGLTFYPPPH